MVQALDIHMVHFEEERLHVLYGMKNTTVHLFFFSPIMGGMGI